MQYRAFESPEYFPGLGMSRQNTILDLQTPILDKHSNLLGTWSTTVALEVPDLFVQYSVEYPRITVAIGAAEGNGAVLPAGFDVGFRIPGACRDNHV